jgi:NAD+ diphosphatase
MDHRSQSRRNGLCGHVVDRITHLRSDEGWLAARLTDPNSRVVPVWRSRNLIRVGDDLSAVMLELSEAGELLASTDTIVLLGEEDGIAYFAASVSAQDSEQHQRLCMLGEFRDLRETAQLLSAREGALLAHARAMMFWHQTHRHCGTCGAPTRLVEAGHSRVCTDESCKRSVYPRTDPAVIVSVSRGDRLLLGRKPDWPAGRFSTVAGFVEPGETLEEAVAREVKEETGIVCDEVTYHSSQPWPFPSSIMLGFHATASTDEITVDTTELDDARWFTRDEMVTGLLSGSFLLPRSLSISFRLIEDWFDAGRAEGTPTLRELGAGRTW